MRTTRLEALVSVATTRFSSGGVPYLNKFEQVSSDHHQMSLAGGPRYDVQGRGRGTLPDMSWGIPYHVTYPMIHLMLPTTP